MSTIRKLPRILLQKLRFPARSFAQEPCSEESEKRVQHSMKRLTFNVSEYNKYGLYTHDVLADDTPDVKEALRRLPKDVLDARNFRLIRALQLDFLRIRLPKEQWITYEQDIEYRYLQPYLDEIHAEKQEIYEFGCVNYEDDDPWPADEIK